MADRTPTVAALPPSPRQAGAAAGWWHGTRGRAWLIAHRMRMNDGGRRSSTTLCGRRAADPERVESGALAAVCATCERAARTLPVLSAPVAVPGQAPAVDPLVALLLGPGYDLDGLIAQHRDDGTGHCRTCGGPQSGRLRVPCATAVAAGRADSLRRRTRLVRQASR